MRKLFTGESKWIGVFVLMLASLLALGVLILPEVFAHGYAVPGTPASLYALTLLTLALFLGVLVSLAAGRFERLMIALFVILRIVEVAWQYNLGRHSLWYLAGSVCMHVLAGGLAFFCIHRDRCRPFKR